MTLKPTNIAPAYAIANETIQELRKRQQNPELYRPIPINIPELDAAFGGIVLPSYVAVGGPAKAGKTTLLTKVADEITKPVSDEKGLDTKMVVGKDNIATPLKVLYFHLEETQFQFGVRMLTMRTPTVSRTMIRDLQLTDESFTALEAGAGELVTHGIEMTDMVYKASEMIEMALDMKAQCIVVDTFNLLEDGNGVDEAKRLAENSRKFLQARNIHNLTTIAAYQLNDMNKAFGTRALYKDCDLIMEVKPAKDHNKSPIDGQLTINILPSRQAPGNVKVDVAFSGAFNLIQPLTKLKQFDFKSISETIEKGEIH